MKEPDKLNAFDGVNPEEKPDLNQIVQESQNNISSEVGEITSQTISSKIDSSNPQVQGEIINKTTSAMINAANVIHQSKSESENEKKVSEVSENNVKSIESKNLSSLIPKSEPIDDNENKIDVDEKVPPKEIKDNKPQANLDKNNLISNVSGIKENQSIKNETADNLPTKENNNIDSKQIIGNNEDGSKLSKKLPELIDPATENDNELKNGNFPDEEDKSKVKQTNLENQEGKEIEKPKETVYEGPNEVLPENDSKLPEPSTQSSLPDEDVEHQEDKDQYSTYKVQYFIYIYLFIY